WHIVAGLKRLWISNPCGERAARGLQKAGSDIFTSSDMGEVGTGFAVRSHSTNCMTSRALLRHKNLLSCNRLGIGRRHGVVSLQCGPRLKRGLLFGDNEKRHVGVLQTAKLGALTTIHARTLGANGKLIRAAGNQILFARKAWHPEGVNDIETFELKPDVSSDRNMNLVRCLEAQLRLRTEIFDAPPPLQAS